MNHGLSQLLRQVEGVGQRPWHKVAWHVAVCIRNCRTVHIEKVKAFPKTMRALLLP